MLYLYRSWRLVDETKTEKNEFAMKTSENIIMNLSNNQHFHV